MTRSGCIRDVAFLSCLALATASAQQTKQAGNEPLQQPPVVAGQAQTQVTEQIRKTVGFLTVGYRNGAVQGGVIGTCFFVSVPDRRLDENKSFIYLVTNRHVAQPGIDLGTPYEVQGVFLRLNLATPQQGYQSMQFQVPIGSGHTKWFFPTDESVDLAILPLAPDASTVDYSTVPSNMIVDSEQLRNGDVGVGDPVTFAGYFANFPGQVRMQPIVRQGVLAMLPEEKLSTTLHKQGRIFFADLHAFHGNSGSPVFVNLGGLHRGSLVWAYNYKLIGVLSGYYPESEAFSVPAATVLTGEVKDNSGIATIVPAEELAKLLNSPEVQADRDSQVAAMPKKP